MKPVIERVLDKVIRIPFSGCWIFTGATNHWGYGMVGMGSRGAATDRVHRVTYRHFRGDIPNGLFVCHTCDVPSCCNPDHLFLGSNQDNVNDMIKKGRGSSPPRNLHVVGSAHPLSKLTEDEAVKIRHMYSQGVIQEDLAKLFGVARQTISKVVNHKRYKNACA